MKPNTLIIGYGNPGRQDDGLGPGMIAELAKNYNDSSHLQLRDVYQLTVDDALLVCEFERVVFVDAARTLDEPFIFLPIEASDQNAFGTHSLSPQGVLELAQTLYQAAPKAYLMAIQGFEFDDFEEALSIQATANLAQAKHFLCDWIERECLQQTESMPNA